jgi:hypothetical protein
MNNEIEVPPGPMLSITPCRAFRTDGSPCGAPPSESGFCYWHDPERREQMLEASKKGGSRKSLTLPEAAPLVGNEARAILAAVLIGLLDGAIDPTTARAVAYIMQVERKILETDELERKLEALEDIVRSRGR